MGGPQTWFGRFAGEAFDLPGSSSGWTYHDFRGSRWQNIKNEFNRGYLKNAYR